jgi:hypothetical protein
MANSYWPDSKGSTWKYRTTGPFNSEYSDTATGEIKIINGISFTKFKYSRPDLIMGSTEAYIGSKDNNLYIAERRMPPANSLGLLFDYYGIFSNFNQSKGYSWEMQSGSALDFIAYCKGELISTDTSITVNGKSYPHVIHSRVNYDFDIQRSNPPGRQAYAYFDIYLAKGVGLIKKETTFSAQWGGNKFVTELLDYHIK